MVFESFPVLEGRYLSYSEYFMLIGSAGALLLSCCVFLVGLFVLFLFSPSFKDNHLHQYSYLPLFPAEHWAQFTYQLCAWVSAYLFSFVFIIFSMFDWVHPVWTIGTSLAILGFRLWSWCAAGLAQLHRDIQWGGYTRRVFQLQQQRSPAALYILLIILVGYSVVLPVISCGMCICFYNPSIGLPLPGQASLSTWFLRLVSLEDACPPGAPCNTYLTLPEDSAHNVFVNCHTSPSQPTVNIHYGLQPDQLQWVVTMKRFELEGLERKADRLVHSVLLTNLTANTPYYFSLEYYQEVMTPVRWFQTLPDSDTSLPVVFISGGDAGNTPQAYTMTQRAGEQDPLVAFVGGDIAYDDALPTCYQAWDLFISQWSNYMTSSSGRLVPMVLTVGNHDVGQDSQSYRNVTIGPAGPMYFAYFPQHFARDLQGNIVYDVPEIANRKSYFYHHLGNAVMLSLDSAYVEPMDGEQLAWLASTLEALAPTYPVRFVTYHVPLYPSSPSMDLSIVPVALGIKYWVPLFDQYSVMTVFENHVHSFKRTNPLSCSLASPAGTVYVGDGQWGAKPSGGPWDTDPEIFVKEGVQFHVWRVEVGLGEVTFTAIGLQPGSVVDNFTREY